jgi:hypothetical protein
MGRRWLVNLTLLAVLAVLGLAIRSELAREGRPQTLAGLDAADLSLIRLEREGEPVIRIERTPDGWQMREPMQADADPVHLKKLLEIVSAPVYRSVPAQSADLAELGLAPSKLRLQLDSLVLAFGGLDPLGQRRYVAADGLVHLIDDRFHHLLIAPAIDWVSRGLLPAGQPPAFATLGGVPLGPDGLTALAGLRAERVEPLTGELAGEAAQVKYRDGRAVRFLVSEDRRRWSRLDLKLRYVLPDAPRLAQDPSAVDPTPPEPPIPAPAPASPPGGAPTTLPVPVAAGADQPLEPPGTFLDPEAPRTEPQRPPREHDPDDPFAPVPEGEIGAAPAETGEPADPDAPPEVRLSPDGYDGEDPGDRESYDDEVGGAGLRGEPYKDPPQGFGADPFAPDPALESEEAPPTRKR